MKSALFSGGIALSLSDFNQLFPFHLVVDKALAVKQAGPSLLRICPEAVPGVDVGAWFSLIWPRAALSFQALADAQAVAWRHIPSGLRFKGQALMADGAGVAILLCSPWVEEHSELLKFGLGCDDFALHDPTVDLLRTQMNALQDERELADKISVERADLLRENHELSRQFGLLWDELVTLKQEEADIYKLSLIASKADSPIVVTGVDGRVEWVNAGFTQITGYTQEEMFGRKPGEVLHGEKTDPKTVAYIRSQFGKGEGFSAELVNYRKSGQAYWVQIEAQPLMGENNEIINWMAIERDITERKVSELALMEAKQAAESANRAKSEFLAKMSHEIRTPMHGVRGMLDLLRRSALTPEQQEFADTAAHSVENLLAVINDVLDFSKIEAGKLDLDLADFDLRELIEQACVLLAPAAHGKALALHCFIQPGLPCRLRGDPTRLRQIMTNLIGNAVKFTSEGEVCVEVACLSQDEERAVLCFTVKDTGIGIRPEDRHRLFSPFEQVDGATTRRFGGTGLGLAITKSLVNRMGGEIHVESEPGTGSRFWFTADFKKQAPSEPPELSGGLAGRKILVLDASATGRAILGRLLNDWGAEAALTGQAGPALAALREAHLSGSPFKLAVLDLQTPDIDRLVSRQALAREEALKNLPCVLLSSGLLADEGRHPENGPHPVIAKPIRQRQLLAALLSGLDKPLQRPKSAEAGAAEKPPQFPGCRVLLVEDNPINQKVALKMLERYRLDAVLADNGAKALAELGRNRYDLVLMDCHMPEMNGYDATLAWRVLEAERHLPRTPVVALTANFSSEAQEKCLESGMDDFLAKPFLFGDLTGLLARWLPSPDAGASPWDYPVALRRVGGDMELLREMGGLFLEQAPKQLERLRSWDGQEPAAIAEAAHFIKGMSLHFCAQAVVDLAAGVEQKAREKAIAPADPMILRLIDALGGLADALRRDLLAPGDPPPSS